MIQVLIPTDFSESARHAVDYAFKLFPHSDFEVHLLNVYEMVHASSEMIISIDDVPGQIIGTWGEKEFKSRSR